MAIDYEKEGRIAIITINRPEAMNSLDSQHFQELHDRLVDFRDDPELWVGIITGAGERAFSAGADLKELRVRPVEVTTSIMRGLELWKPLIAAIHGYALGGGLEIALACDLRIAADNAQMGQPEVTAGTMSAWGGSQRLPRIIPSGRAAEMLFTGQRIDAQEAYRIGLVNKVVPRDQLMAEAKQLAEAICRNGPLAVRGTKEAMIRGSSMTLEEGLKLEKELAAVVKSSEDFQEGAKAFAEKRKPEWEGR